MKYYYNNVPGKGLCRNNLIYTSLINEDKTEFKSFNVIWIERKGVE